MGFFTASSCTSTQLQQPVTTSCAYSNINTTVSRIRAKRTRQMGRTSWISFVALHAAWFALHDTHALRSKRNADVATSTRFKISARSRISTLVGANSPMSRPFCASLRLTWIVYPSPSSSSSSSASNTLRCWPIAETAPLFSSLPCPTTTRLCLSAWSASSSALSTRSHTSESASDCLQAPLTTLDERDAPAHTRTDGYV